MLNITIDPTNPNRLVLTQTVTMYLDKLLDDVLSQEVATVIREQAKKDIVSNTAVKKAISKAATLLLMQKLGVPPDSQSTEPVQSLLLEKLGVHNGTKTKEDL